jgi:hypothetical protein
MNTPPKSHAKVMTSETERREPFTPAQHHAVRERTGMNGMALKFDLIIGSK